MPVDVNDHAFAGLVAKSLKMLGRLGDAANDFANGRAIVQAIDPYRGAGIGRSLEHLAIHLLNDLPRIRRAQLLGNRERWDNTKRADEYGYTPHDNLLSSALHTCVWEQRCTSTGGWCKGGTLSHSAEYAV
jgi:hypothetical protein